MDDGYDKLLIITIIEYCRHQENINGLKPPDLSVDVILGFVEAPKFIYGALITNYELRITNYIHAPYFLFRIIQKIKLI
ncbi:hypothetical protein Riv7116_6317 [Rivularia sp. PCC 7116]|nr:hypothetical protein Riv7116_6317 [Rivularia sp. PCC 7116]